MSEPETFEQVLSDMFGSTWSEQIPLMRLRHAIERELAARIRAAKRIRAVAAEIYNDFAEHGPVDHPVNVPIFQERGLRWASTVAAIASELEGKE